MTNSKSWSVEKEDDQVWDDLFPHRTEDVGDYLNPEGLNEAMLDIEPSAHTTVATHEDETKDMDILETTEAPMENVPLLVALIETITPEISPPVEATATDHITTTRHVSVETTHGEVTGCNALISQT